VALLSAKSKNTVAVQYCFLGRGTFSPQLRMVKLFTMPHCSAQVIPPFAKLHHVHGELRQELKNPTSPHSVVALFSLIEKTPIWNDQVIYRSRDHGGGRIHSLELVEGKPARRSISPRSLAQGAPFSKSMSPSTSRRN
jgi:hypothetical protein